MTVAHRHRAPHEAPGAAHRVRPGFVGVGRLVGLTLLLVLAGLTPRADPALADAAGPGQPGLPITELLGEGGPAIPMKDQAMLLVTLRGYRYIAGQQDSDLTISLVDGRLQYVDTGTERWKRVPRVCRRLTVPRGIGASCPVPARLLLPRPVFLEVWPRLGDDTITATDLPANVRMWVLADDGADVISTGPGDDFVNAAQGDDRVDTGDGDDWVRGGIGTNVLASGPGEDRLVGGDEQDTLDAGEGDDTVWGGLGDDLLTGGPGADLINGAGGRDTAVADATDRVRDCERILDDLLGI
ncbi:calcium-binding protein [Nocardioides sp.]|uniref:calcium-binding protein n=1 Tax=Nocardioides sp. TaxID=35761 RepID=UPI00351257A5